MRLAMTRFVGVAFVLFFGLSSAARAEPGGLEMWQHNHPVASQALGRWVRNHPYAAGPFFDWDAHHPNRSHAFVTWAITHPEQGLDAFVATHPGWPFLSVMMERHHPAAQTFIGWCRRFPRAAEALMSRPGGLAWAGHHLYRDAWRMGHPER